jgi:hypothetical protein
MNYEQTNHKIRFLFNKNQSNQNKIDSLNIKETLDIKEYLIKNLHFNETDWINVFLQGEI